MRKTILILNGSPRPTGNTVALVDAFAEGAQAAGHTVLRHDVRALDIHPCLGCLGGGKDPAHPCVQRDGMEAIYPDYRAADVLVFASPMYYWALSGQLKCALDRLFAVTECDPALATPRKATVLLMASEGDTPENYAPVRQWYEALCGALGWKDLGQVVAGGVLRVGDIAGHPALPQAKALGAAIGEAEA